MFCHHCGSPVTAEAAACPACGRPLSVSPGPETSSPQPPSPGARPVNVAIGRWIAEAWEFISPDIGLFLAAGFLFTLLAGVAAGVLQGALIVGLHLMCLNRIRSGRTSLNDLFQGFNYFLPALVASLLIGLFVTLGAIACIIPGLVIGAMYMFTFLFILDRKLDFWPAMQASHALVRQDYWSFTLFFIALALLQLAGLALCLVGVFVTIPLAYAAITLAYRDLVGFASPSPA